MLRIYQILVSVITLAASTVGLSACGQPGGLYLPTEPAAANRATLPETLNPLRTVPKATTTPSSPVSVPAQKSNPATP